MPTYQAVCGKCEHYQEYHSSVARCMETPLCEKCGVKTLKVIYTAPKGFVKGRFEAFKSPVDGSIIRTNRELSEHNKRNNVVSLADGYSNERVIKGDFGKSEALDPADRKKDIAESIQMLNQGYKPQRGAEDVG